MTSVTKLMTSSGELLRSKLLSSGVHPGYDWVKQSGEELVGIKVGDIKI